MKYTTELHESMRQYIAEYEPLTYIEPKEVSALLDEIERLQSAATWIPVSERLPEFGVWVDLFLVDNDFHANAHVTDGYFEGMTKSNKPKFFIYPMSTRQYQVTHWRTQLPPDTAQKEGDKK